MSNKKNPFIPDRPLYSAEDAASVAGVSIQQLMRAASKGEVSLWVRAPDRKQVRSIYSVLVEIEALPQGAERKYRSSWYQNVPTIPVDVRGMYFRVSEADCTQIAISGVANPSVFESAIRINDKSEAEVHYPPKGTKQMFAGDTPWPLPWLYSVFALEDNGYNIASRLNEPLDPSALYIKGVDLGRFIRELSVSPSEHKDYQLKISPECDCILKYVYNTMRRFHGKLTEPDDGSNVWGYISKETICEHLENEYDLTTSMANALAAVVRPVLARKDQSEVARAAYSGFITPEFEALYRGWEYRHQIFAETRVQLGNAEMQAWLRKEYSRQELSENLVKNGAAAICNKEGKRKRR